MEITFQKEDGCQKYYSVSAPWEDLEPRFREVVKTIRSQARLPGFRQGKAPEGMLKGRFAKEIREEVLEHLLPEAAKTAVEKFSLKPVVEPYVEAVAFEEGRPFTCTLIVEEAPEVPQVRAEGLTVESPKVDVSDGQVDQVMERLRQRAAVMKPLEDPSQPGDFVVAELTRQGQSKPFERLLGALPNSPEAAERAVVGLKAGDETDVEVTDEPHEHEPGHEHVHLAPGHYHVKVAKVMRREIPELNDDFAKDMGAESLEAFRARLRKDVEADVAGQVRAIQEERLIDLLVERHKLALPPTLVERQLKSDLEEMAQEFTRRGGDLKKADIDWDALIKSRKPAAERKVAAYYLLDAAARSAGLSASDEDLDAYFAARSAGTGLAPEKVRAYHEKEGRLDDIRTMIAHKKALGLLLSQASVTFTEGKSAAQEEENAPDPHSRGADEPR